MAWEAVFPAKQAKQWGTGSWAKHPGRQELETGVQQMRQADVKL